MFLLYPRTFLLKEKKNNLGYRKDYLQEFIEQDVIIINYQMQLVHEEICGAFLGYAEVY